MKQPNDTHILIVEDDDDLREAIAFDFKRKKFITHTASNGKDASEIIRSQKIDVVISDVRMPNGGGIELLRDIKNYNISLPVVILITGYMDITLEEAYHEGAEAIFSKPFDRKALFEAVDRLRLPKEKVWSDNSIISKKTDEEIKLHIPDFEQALHDKNFNLGRGGVFIAMSFNFPQENSCVPLKITIDQPAATIAGAGIVRWIRLEAKGPEKSGCGIEFMFLEEDSKLELKKFATYMNGKPFIPKS